MLMADFSGLNHLEEIVVEMLQSLGKSQGVQANVAHVQSGSMPMEAFDGWFAELVRKELGKTLGIVRAKAVEKARRGGAGSAASGVSRRMYKDRLGGNINILPSKKRKSSKKREYTEGKQRTVSARTRLLNEYYGPDRDFILRFLDGGTDVRTVEPHGATGRGSRASYGRRGAIAPRSFFHTMGNDMEQAAKEMGYSILGNVEKFIEMQYSRINNG